MVPAKSAAPSEKDGAAAPRTRERDEQRRKEDEGGRLCEKCGREERAGGREAAAAPRTRKPPRQERSLEREGRQEDQ